MVDFSAKASLERPPDTVAYDAVASFEVPPETVDESEVDLLNDPPLIVEFIPDARLFCPDATPDA